MGKSICKIKQANECFYSTYANSIARKNLVPMILFFCCWCIEMLFMKLSFDKVYYFKIARFEDLGNLEVKEWVKMQVCQNIFNLGNIIVILLIVSVGGLLFWVWKKKAYELHKYWKKVFYLPIKIVIVGNALIIIYSIFTGNQYMGRNIFLLVMNIAVYFASNKILLPLEIKVRGDYTWNHEVICKLIDCVSKVIDFSQKLIDKI